MGQVFYIADTHFAHPAIAKARGFSSAAEQDRALLTAWQRRVKAEDTVYIVGDLFAYRADTRILQELTGRLHLVMGNHEPHWLKRVSRPERYFHRIVEGFLEITDDGCRVVMCHYPCPSLRPTGDEETYYLHGHLHAELPRRTDWAVFCRLPRVLNVGVDIAHCAAGGWAPATLHEWMRFRDARGSSSVLPKT